MKPILLFGLLALSLLVGCGGNPPDAAVVVVDSTAVPTLAATDLPTALPEPTATASPVPPSPSPTTPPTATPAPTETPTNAPPATPEPTFTPTVAPTAPRIIAPTRAPTTPSIDTSAILRGQVNEAIRELGNYRWTFYKAFGTNRGFINPTGAIDCRSIINSHDRILTLISLDVSGSDPAIQNAYSVALQGVEEFSVATEVWTESCRQALAIGNETLIIDQFQYSNMLQDWAKPEALWNQVIHMLDQ